jgi:two-component system chemotaxis sensor kinase CheA
MRLGEILVKSGALTEEELEQGLRAQAASARATTGERGPREPSYSILTQGELDQALRAQTAGVCSAVAEGGPPPIGQILVEQNVVQPEIVAAAADKQKLVAEKKTQESRLIRVQADKLDQLIDLVGELVIAGASASLLAQKSGQGTLVEASSVLSRLVESIRDSALQLRMVQIGETFSRFNRVVRDTAREIGKEIDLVITGAETELDKSVVEKLGDPLMHLVRNAIDHGIEATALRVERGKSATGTVRLNAFHDSGSIVIEVSDDGGGLPKEKIRAKAVEKGLIDVAAQLSDQEIIDLIFAAGFSTADQVTNISGRGVGMDVVRRNIQGLRGSVNVKTAEGQGSTFTIRLPLTLAIIDGFLTSVSNSSYVIPLDMVIECIELKNIPTDRNYLNLRGEVLPFVRLRELFEIEGTAPVRQNVVIVQYAGRKAGLVVDVLLGEFQTVIKPLAAMFRHLRGIGGSTILGSGEVALILDVQALMQMVANLEEVQIGRTQKAELSAVATR